MLVSIHSLTKIKNNYDLSNSNNKQHNLAVTSTTIHQVFFNNHPTGTIYNTKQNSSANHPPNKMASSAAKSDTTVLSKSIPIRLTDLSIFDDNYSSMRERFVAEMKRCEEEMNKFRYLLTVND